MKGCICHFTKRKIHLFLSTGIGYVCKKNGMTCSWCLQTALSARLQYPFVTTRDFNPMLVWCWHTVRGVHSASSQRWVTFRDWDIHVIIWQLTQGSVCRDINCQFLFVTDRCKVTGIYLSQKDTKQMPPERIGKRQLPQQNRGIEPMLVQWVKASCLRKIDTWKLCWSDVGRQSATLAQH